MSTLGQGPPGCVGLPLRWLLGAPQPGSALSPRSREQLEMQLLNF